LKVCKVDEERHLVFGWSSMAVRKDGAVVVDSQDDKIAPADLEEAVYSYVAFSGEANAMHDGPAVGQLVESLVVTPEKLEKMGLKSDALPQGWWTGFHVEDAKSWDAVKSGKYRMFSIEGRATREGA